MGLVYVLNSTRYIYIKCKRGTVKLLPWGTTCCNSKLILSRVAFTGAGAGDVLAPKLIHLVQKNNSFTFIHESNTVWSV